MDIVREISACKVSGRYDFWHLPWQGMPVDKEDTYSESSLPWQVRQIQLVSCVEIASLRQINLRKSTV